MTAVRDHPKLASEGPSPSSLPLPCYVPGTKASALAISASGALRVSSLNSPVSLPHETLIVLVFPCLRPFPMVHKPFGPGMSSDLKPSCVALAEGCLLEQGCNREKVPSMKQECNREMALPLWQGCNREMTLSMGQGCNREMVTSMGSCEFCAQALLLLTTVFLSFIICEMEARG